jgi:hypothetical protein
MTMKSIEIDKDYLMGKTVIAKGFLHGRIIAISESEFGQIIFAMAPFNGEKIEYVSADDCSIKNIEDETAQDQVFKAFEVASQHRKTIADNIYYTQLNSGGDTTQYKKSLVEVDMICNDLLQRLSNPLQRLNKRLKTND